MPRDIENFDERWETLRHNIRAFWPNRYGADRIVAFVQKIIDERDGYKHQMEVEREINGQARDF